MQLNTLHVTLVVSIVTHQLNLSFLSLRCLSRRLQCTDSCAHRGTRCYLAGAHLESAAQRVLGGCTATTPAYSAVASPSKSQKYAATNTQQLYVYSLLQRWPAVACTHHVRAPHASGGHACELSRCAVRGLSVCICGRCFFVLVHSMTGTTPCRLWHAARVLSVVRRWLPLRRGVDLRHHNRTLVCVLSVYCLRACGAYDCKPLTHWSVPS